MDRPHHYQPPGRTDAAAPRPAEEFEWYRVSKAVGNVRNHGPELIQPIEVDDEA